ncbi:CaiB/BaiF CoA-transferase family protein [Streptomyces sp. NBC_01306]|uniref:CaiB/BaiF CoA transferase family protein n=1 Tax=Streptomyces sp. NBC_01306 TaxID=2903819 RepID=UPI002259F06D|nr:CoA transferase [Streptomyces sp. NBC_01306]MCX4726459.1 CoA transferase [Streptomyces sp. NBC_01306]
MQALDAIRVLDFTQMMLGPFATQLLADLGADVIKVERPEGEWERDLAMMGEYVDGESAAFLAMNRNKRSVALDLKDPRAKDALLKLAATCDVVVENFRPGVMDRLGLGYADFKAVRDDIIYCSGSGWGQDTGFAREGRPGQDLLIQSMSGLAASTGRDIDPPTPAGTAIVDHATALTLANGIMAAIIARSTHGIGQRVEVDLYSTAIAMQCQEISAFVNQGAEYRRSGSGIGQPWLSAPFGIYETSDGWMAIAMAPLETVASAVGVAGIADFDAWTERDGAKNALEAIIRTNTAQHWLDVLLPAGVWAAKVRSTKEAVDELREQGSDLLVTVDGPAGTPIELVGCPVSLSGTPWRQRLAPPRIGEHTAAVFGEVLDDVSLANLVGDAR